MDKMIFLDVETTGLNPAVHEIIDIAIIGSGINYHKKVKPLNLEYASPEALLINGFTSLKWRYADQPEEVAREIAPLIAGATIVGHNPFFDMSFIEELFHQYDIDVQYDRRLIDTVTLAHAHLKPLGCNSLSLDNIRVFMGWSLLDNHTAYQDAIDCMKLYDDLISINPAKKLFWKYRNKLRKLLRKFR